MSRPHEWPASLPLGWRRLFSAGRQLRGCRAGPPGALLTRSRLPSRRVRVLSAPLVGGTRRRHCLRAIRLRRRLPCRRIPVVPNCKHRRHGAAVSECACSRDADHTPLNRAVAMVTEKRSLNRTRLFLRYTTSLNSMYIK